MQIQKQKPHSMMWGTRLSTLPWDFPKGESILGVSDMPCTYKNKNEQLPAGKTNQQTPNACHLALIPIESFLDGSGRNVGDGNIVCRNEPMVKIMVEYHHAGIPKGLFSIHVCQPP